MLRCGPSEQPFAATAKYARGEFTDYGAFEIFVFCRNQDECYKRAKNFTQTCVELERQEKPWLNLNIH
jgi:hypothetical protein